MTIQPPQDGALDAAPDATPPPSDDAGVPLQHAAERNFRQAFKVSDKPQDAYTTSGFDAWNEDAETAIMPSATAALMEETLASGGTAITVESDTRNGVYSAIVGQSQLMVPMDEQFEASATREGAEWSQRISSPTGDIVGGVPRPKPKTDGNWTTEQARTIIRSKMHLGSAYLIPLWHSGFWLLLRAPTEAELLTLQRQIAESKVAIGRQTYGLAFSNTTVYTSRHLIDFVLDHLIETSLQTTDATDLRQHILLPDLPLMVHAITCALYPSGFQYVRACTADIHNCRHLVREKLNLSRLLWTDQSKLTERQIKHMQSRARGSMTLDAVQLYRDSFLAGQDKKVQLDDGLSVTLAISTLEQHLTAGYRWADMVERTYGNALTSDPTARAAFLSTQVKATLMREYTHLVKSVAVDIGEDEDKVFDTTDIIETTLNDLTARDDIREKFMAAVKAYLDDSLVSMVAIPTYDCPVCGKPQKVTTADSPYKELIPLDVAQTFFYLAHQRTENIKSRDLKAINR